jgi:ABC-2 type transport system permease protein
MAQQYAAYAQQVINGTNRSPVNIKYLYNPQMESSYNFVPGIMGMLLLLICALMTSISIVREKERGSMEVLLVSPVRPLMVIIAKMVPYMVMGFVILTSILLMAKYLMAVPLTGSLLLIYLLSMLYILLALSLGLLISTVADTQLTALLFSAMVLLMPCLLHSGTVFPIESMPHILQWLTYVVPPRYYVEAMRKLMIMGTGFDSVRIDFFVLFGMTVALMALALKNYKQRLE